MFATKSLQLFLVLSLGLISASAFAGQTFGPRETAKSFAALEATPCERIAGHRWYGPRQEFYGARYENRCQQDFTRDRVRRVGPRSTIPVIN